MMKEINLLNKKEDHIEKVEQEVEVEIEKRNLSLEEIEKEKDLMTIDHLKEHMTMIEENPITILLIDQEKIDQEKLIEINQKVIEAIAMREVLDNSEEEIDMIEALDKIEAIEEIGEEVEDLMIALEEIEVVEEILDQEVEEEILEVVEVVEISVIEILKMIKSPMYLNMILKLQLMQLKCTLIYKDFLKNSHSLLNMVVDIKVLMVLNQAKVISKQAMFLILTVCHLNKFQQEKNKIMETNEFILHDLFILRDLL